MLVFLSLNTKCFLACIQQCNRAVQDSSFKNFKLSQTTKFINAGFKHHEPTGVTGGHLRDVCVLHFFQAKQKAFRYCGKMTLVICFIPPG